MAPKLGRARVGAAIKAAESSKGRLKDSFILPNVLSRKVRVWRVKIGVLKQKRDEVRWKLMDEKEMSDSVTRLCFLYTFLFR